MRRDDTVKRAGNQDSRNQELRCFHCGTEHDTQYQLFLGNSEETTDQCTFFAIDERLSIAEPSVVRSSCADSGKNSWRKCLGLGYPNVGYLVDDILWVGLPWSVGV